MDDDGVEMEFVSVLGVLVPMEVTKGVSDKAKRLAAGGVSSEDEAQERAEDPFPDSNLDQDPTIPEHTETKCDASGCTNSAETQGSKHSETTSPKTADVHGHCVGHNDPVAPAGAQKSGVFGEKKAETEKSEKAACTPTTERSPVENGMKSVKEKQEVKVKKQKQKRGSKKRRGEEAKDDRRLSVEASGTSTKKHKRQSTKPKANADAKTNLDSSPAKFQQNDKSHNNKTVAGTPPTSKHMSTSEDKMHDETTKPVKLEPTVPASAPGADSQRSPTAILKPKRRVKIPRVTEDEARTKLGPLRQRKPEPAASGGKVRNARKLESDNEAHGNKGPRSSSKSTKLQTSAPPGNTTSLATEETIEATTSSDQGRCARSTTDALAARFRAAPSLLTQAASALLTVGEHDARRMGARVVLDRWASAMPMVVALCAPTQSVRLGRRPRVNALLMEGVPFAPKRDAISWLFRTGNALRMVGGLSAHTQDVPTVCIYGANASIMSKKDAATGANDTGKRPEKSSTQSAEVAVNITGDKSYQHSRSNPGGHAEAKAKSAHSESNGMGNSSGFAPKRVRNNTSDFTEVESVNERKMMAKRRRNFSVAEPAPVEQEAMSLRSGQQIARIVDSRYDLQSEEEAMQMALKLSEIEY
ncbi:hypothetical protein ON010_g9530 [Phytophthora cinnamomi]|nr:hypothetical protein ON010_g9530 [Phytophthora cinnamomi]